MTPHMPFVYLLNFFLHLKHFQWLYYPHNILLCLDVVLKYYFIDQYQSAKSKHDLNEPKFHNVICILNALSIAQNFPFPDFVAEFFPAVNNS